ncbi:MAG: hypothetical protein FGM41_07710 [Bacteroidetes bacterium]|nr:hypothetical protein [Bacteroidota bacterium]
MFFSIFAFMRKLKGKLILCLVILLSFQVQAQQVEVGLMLGASNYLGDLSNETFVMKETHFSASIFGRYNFRPKFSMKGFIGYGRVSGDDKNFESVTRTYNGVEDFKFNYFRNLNFYSDIYEASMHFEYNILPVDLNSYQARPFVPYVFGGIGIFHFNPKTTFEGKTIELQPLGTEGQGSTAYNDQKKYSLTRLCIPIGFGFRQKIGDDFFLGFEAGLRLTTTNYLDDVGGVYGDHQIVFGASGRTAVLLSDRSWERDPVNDPNLNPLTENFVFEEGFKKSDRSLNKTDMYFMAGITLSYTIRFRGQGCPTF